MGDISLSSWADRLERRRKYVAFKAKIRGNVVLDRSLYLKVLGHRKRYFRGSEGFRLSRREQVNNHKLTKWL